MLGILKLQQAKIIIEQFFSAYLNNLSFEPKLARIFIQLRDGIQFYIRYNNFDQYSYSIIFSKDELDRCRFDNYDDRWKVTTRPNHFHPRYNRFGFSSPMIGDPEKDIPMLCELIISGKLLPKNIRF